MITYYETRRRDRKGFGDLYRVRSWYFLGILVFRTWVQLTTTDPLPSERE